MTAARRAAWLPGRGTLAGLVLALGCLGCFLAIDRQSLHGVDAFLVIKAVEKGEAGDVAGRSLYIDLARGASEILRPLVPSVFEALRILSALGVAAGVFFAHRIAIALRLERRTPWLALAFGCSPAAVYFASIVEVDGLLLGAANAAWYGLVRLVRRPVPLRAMTLGLLTGLTASLHGGGHLLLAVACAQLAAWSLQRSRRRRSWRPARRALGLAALAIAAHAALFAVTGAWRDGQQLEAAGSITVLSLPLGRMPMTLWHEWLLPYAPFAVLWLGSLGLASMRWLAACHATCLAGYLALTNAVLAYYEPLEPETVERGAFMVAICLPTVLLGLVWLRPWARPLAVAAAAILALVQVRSGDWQPMPPGFDTGLLRVAAREPLELWVGGLEGDAGWVRKRAPLVRTFPPVMLPCQIEVLERKGARLGDEHVAAWFDAWYDILQREGRSMLITPAGLEAMRAASDPRIRRLATDHVPSRYDLERVAEDAFVAFRVRRR